VISIKRNLLVQKSELMLQIQHIQSIRQQTGCPMTSSTKTRSIFCLKTKLLGEVGGEKSMVALGFRY
jgi:hypothetical protein